TATYYGLYFDVLQEFTLMSVDVYPDGSTGDLEIQILDSQANVLHTTTHNIATVHNGQTPVTVPINFTIPPGTDYRLTKSNNFDDLRCKTASSPVLPYPY